MGNYNTDYRKELKPGTKPTFVKGQVCPKCGARLIVLPPDRTWCEKEDCDTGQLHLIGKGTGELQTYQE